MTRPNLLRVGFRDEDYAIFCQLFDTPSRDIRTDLFPIGLLARTYRRTPGLRAGLACRRPAQRRRVAHQQRRGRHRTGTDQLTYGSRHLPFSEWMLSVMI